MFPCGATLEKGIFPVDFPLYFGNFHCVNEVFFCLGFSSTLLIYSSITHAYRKQKMLYFPCTQLAANHNFIYFVLLKALILDLTKTETAPHAPFYSLPSFLPRPRNEERASSLPLSFKWCFLLHFQCN